MLENGERESAVNAARATPAIKPFFMYEKPSFSNEIFLPVGNESVRDLATAKAWCKSQ
jgi:hypothetical protein